MITPPLSISARPALTLKVPVSISAQWYPAAPVVAMSYNAAVPDRSGAGPPGRVAGEGAADVDQPAVHA